LLHLQRIYSKISSSGCGAQSVCWRLFRIARREVRHENGDFSGHDLSAFRAIPAKAGI